MDGRRGEVTGVEMGADAEELRLAGKDRGHGGDKAVCIYGALLLPLQVLLLSTSAD